MTQKPKLMILGSYHMANPGKDVINFKADDVLTPKSQREVDQIGFRLARAMGHHKVYPVDWNKPPPGDFATIDFESFAKANNQKSLLEEAYSRGRNLVAKEEEIQENGKIETT